MPNWCDNVERIVGPKEQVKALCDNLNKWIHEDVVPNGFANGWLGNIVFHSCLETDKNTSKWNHHCRGELVDGFKYIEKDDEVKLLMDAFDTKVMKDLKDTNNYINVYRIEYYDPEKVEDHG